MPKQVVQNIHLGAVPKSPVPVPTPRRAVEEPTTETQSEVPVTTEPAQEPAAPAIDETQPEPAPAPVVGETTDEQPPAAPPAKANYIFVKNINTFGVIKFVDGTKFQFTRPRFVTSNSELAKKIREVAVRYSIIEQ